MSLTDNLTNLVEAVVERMFDQRVTGIVYARVAQITETGVRLQYQGLNIPQPSVIARLASPMAGHRRGAFFRPEVGDEVIVAFEHGDLSHPVVLGALWNDDDAPPEQADTGESNNVRTLVSRDGHEITLDDSPGGSSIRLRTSSGAEILMEDDGKKITITTAQSVANSQLVLDGVSWNHQHATGAGPSGPPVTMGGL